MENLKREPTGATYRILLDTIRQASSKPGDYALIYRNIGALNNAIEQARAIVMPLRSFATVRRPSQTIDFNNGSRIWFLTLEGVESRLRGIRLKGWLADNSVDWIKPETSGYLNTLMR